MRWERPKPKQRHRSAPLEGPTRACANANKDLAKGQARGLMHRLALTMRPQATNVPPAQSASVSKKAKAHQPLTKAQSDFEKMHALQFFGSSVLGCCFGNYFKTTLVQRATHAEPFSAMSFSLGVSNFAGSGANFITSTRATLASAGYIHISVCSCC